ncbi:MAG TPA: ion transporter [Natronosporangium sp.]
MSEVAIEQSSAVRERMRQLVETNSFQRAIMAVIVINALTLGLEAIPSVAERSHDVLDTVDKIALGIFVVELVTKLYIYRLRFFRNPWNVFDFVVVGVSLVPAAGAFSVVRALRVLRVLRLISGVDSMRRVVATLLAAIPGAASIVGLLALVIYVSAVMATMLFGDKSPEYFGDLGQSLWTLFQTLTGEAWPDVADSVMAEYPMAWIFFLIFILISSFVVLNLFLAVIVNAMESVKDAEEADMEAALEETEADIKVELAKLRREIRELKEMLQPAGSARSAEESS